jgi:phage terminase small subunit
MAPRKEPIPSAHDAEGDIRKEKFAQHYFKFGNREKAVVYAGFDCKTKKDNSNSASVTANRLLRDTYVCRRLTELMDQSASHIILSKRKVLSEAARVAFCDPRKLFDPDGRLLPIVDLDDNTAASIASVKVTTEWEDGEDGKKAIGETTEVRFWPKVSALDLLAKYYKLYEKDEKDSGESYHYHFYMPDNQRTNEPIVISTDTRQDDSVLQIPDNGRIADAD